MTASPSGSAARIGVSSAAVASTGVCRSTVRPWSFTAMTSLSSFPADERISRGVLRSGMGTGGYSLATRYLHFAVPPTAWHLAGGAQSETVHLPFTQEKRFCALLQLAGA